MNISWLDLLLFHQLRKSRFFQNCGTFCFDLYWKYHNFERNMIRATGYLKWLDFTRLKIKKMSPLQIFLPVFLTIHRNPKQKYFLIRSRDFEIIPFKFVNFMQGSKSVILAIFQNGLPCCCGPQESLTEIWRFFFVLGAN